MSLTIVHNTMAFHRATLMSVEYNSVKEKVSIVQEASLGLTISKYQCVVRSLK